MVLQQAIHAADLPLLNLQSLCMLLPQELCSSTPQLMRLDVQASRCRYHVKTGSVLAYLNLETPEYAEYPATHSS